MAHRRRTGEISDFFRVVDSALRDIERKLQTGFTSDDDLIQTIVLIERMRQNVGRIRTTVSSDECDSLSAVLDGLSTQLHSLRPGPLAEDPPVADNGVPRVQGRQGAPAYQIERGDLQHLLQLGFSVTAIAEDGLLGQKLHRNTVYNHMKRHHLQSCKQTYGVDDAELRRLIHSYITSHPNSGAEEVRAHLTTLDPPVHVSRERVRSTVTELDPEGVACRWRNVIQRRHYSVEGPNAMWHIDGHHKLARYKIYTHGGIDGYSRLIPYLRCSAFNTSRVAFSAFLRGVDRYQVPSRVRMDEGVENGNIRRFMEAVNGEGRASAIQGQSVHNQRIERLWRDVYCKVVSSFHCALQALEETGALNVDSKLHLFCVQLVFIPCLNEAFEEWRLAHNQHRVRTERNKTPEQLWMAGNVAQRSRDNTAMRNLLSPPDVQEAVHHILPDFDMGEVHDTDEFNKPRPCEGVSDELIANLRQRFNITKLNYQECIDMYAEVLAAVLEIVN